MDQYGWKLSPILNLNINCIVTKSAKSRVVQESWDGIVSRVEVELGGRQSETAQGRDSHPWQKSDSPHCCKPLHSNAELAVK
jgi:hypothetical protein